MKGNEEDEGFSVKLLEQHRTKEMKKKTNEEKEKKN